MLPLQLRLTAGDNRVAFIRFNVMVTIQSFILVIIGNNARIEGSQE